MKHKNKSEWTPKTFQWSQPSDPNSWTPNGKSIWLPFGLARKFIKLLILWKKLTGDKA